MCLLQTSEAIYNDGAMKSTLLWLFIFVLFCGNFPGRIVAEEKCQRFLNGKEQTAPSNIVPTPHLEFYVSSSTGNDDNDGRSPDTPWKTLARAGSVQFVAGNKLLLKSGDVWNEPLVVNEHGAKKSFGTAENPIEISSYGKGKRPAIVRDGARLTCCIQIFEASGWKITNLEIGRADHGIDFHYSTNGNQFLWIENCFFHNIDGSNMYNGMRKPTGRWWEYSFSSAVHISGECVPWNDGYYVADITIKNCAANNAKTLFFNGTANMDALTCNVKNVTLENNHTIGGSWGWCIHFIENAVVRNCTTYGAGELFVEVGAAGGVCHGARNVMVENCTFAYTKFMETDGVGFDFEGRNENVVVRNCDFYMNEEDAILYYNNNGGNFNCAVYNINMLGNGYKSGTGRSGFKVHPHDVGCIVGYVRSDKDPVTWELSDYRLESPYSYGDPVPTPSDTGYPKIIKADNGTITYSSTRTFDGKSACVDPTGNDFINDTGGKSTVKNGAWVQYTFIGTGIEFRGPQCPDQGIFEVWLDGKLVREIDGYNTADLGTQTLYSETSLPMGPHNIKIVKKEGAHLIATGFIEHRDDTTPPIAPKSGYKLLIKDGNISAATAIAQPHDGWTLFYLNDVFPIDKVSVSIKNPGDYTLQYWKNAGLQSDWVDVSAETTTEPGTLEFDFDCVMTNRFRVLPVCSAEDDEITAFSARIADPPIF